MNIVQQCFWLISYSQSPGAIPSFFRQAVEMTLISLLLI